MKAGVVIGSNVGAGGALALGQAGPQIAAPEELLTVPVAGAVGGVVGGLGGAIAGYSGGRKVTEIVNDWVFTPEGN